MKIVTITHRKEKEGKPYTRVQQQLSFFRSLGNYAKGCGWKVEQPASVVRATAHYIANGKLAVSNFTVTPPVKGWFRINWVRPTTRKNNYSDAPAKNEIVRTVKMKVLAVNGKDVDAVTAEEVVAYLKGIEGNTSITLGIDEERHF